ncbi:hypothetical protein [Segetibacter koreensis]|uniref:hypothetical protein n=1 Tax=Segetibacter koreensis TaxID=398037 RepID=UPI00036A676C|nr:hypothetical protein [Segetibacter koreensis]
MLTVIEDFEIETDRLEVTGTGEIRVTNTGGSSASEGGMGSDSDDDKAKGDLTTTGGKKTGNAAGDEKDEDTTFDPIKKNVREAEKKGHKD